MSTRCPSCLRPWSCFSSAPELTADEIRIRQEARERKLMMKAAIKFAKKNNYKVVKPMENIGSRLQKYWMELQDKRGKKSDRKSYILSISKFSTICPLGNKEEVETEIDKINKIMEVISEHPFIHPIDKVAVLTIKKLEADVVIIVQRKSILGSLRDFISTNNEKDFEKSWSEKCVRQEYNEEFQSAAKLYITQILAGMLFLTSIGFPALGNIHLGNVFLTKAEDGTITCAISGHDNTLFGYRTSIFQMVHEAQFIEGLDVIMLGHMLYELATCQQLETVFPTKEQKKRIADTEVREVLKFIFKKTDTKMKHTLKEIFQKMIEKGWHKSTEDDSKVDIITEEFVAVLKKIRL